MEEAPPRIEEIDPEASEAMELAVELAADASEPRDAVAEPADPPRPKMVVEPMVEVKVLPSVVIVVTMAEVVMAEDSPVAVASSEPDPPDPPAPKIVVEPMVEVMVLPSVVMVVTIAEVVMAEDSPVAVA